MKPSLRRLLGLTRPHLALLGASTVAGFVALGCGIALPLATEHLVNNAIGGHERHLIVPLALAALGLSIIRALSNYLRRWFPGLASLRVEADLRWRLFVRLQGLPIAFHDRWQSGQLLARATSDLDSIKNFVGYAIVFLAFLVITAATVFGAIAVQSPTIAVLAAMLAIPWLWAGTRFNRRMEDVFLRSREAVGEVTSVVAESTAGVRILKAFGVERDAVDRLDNSATCLRDVNMEGVRERALYIPLLNLIPNLMLVLVLGVGGFQVMDGTLSIGGLVAITQYLYLLVVPMRYVGWMLSMAQQAQIACDRVFEIIQSEPDIRDHRGALELGPTIGEVRIEDVTFTYPGSTSPALRNVSLTLTPGETVALVGATGSGKSTVAALLPRFIDPENGRVCVDGHDVRTVTLASLRRLIGVVFDEPVLFSATISDNVAFARPDATRDEITAAATAAGADGFVSALPDGYETVVGEQGLSLSGGQRQRLALARALASRPSLLILDDPLSSVDVRTEAEIEANLRALLGTRTTLIIAHRASTVAMADRIVVLDEGQVVASGTHAELLQTSEVYRKVLAADVEIDELTP